MSVKITKDRVSDVLKAVRSLTSKDVLVGIPDSTAGRQPEPGESDPATNALIGYAMEFGLPEQNVPARPFLVPGVRNALPAIVNRMKAGGTKALEGDKQAVDRTMGAVGLTTQNAVRARINEGIPPALAPSTLAARQARGRTGDKPLVDTGQLRNAVTYVIRPTGNKS